MLNGKIALITGASRGIGKAIAQKLAALGAQIALVDLADSGEGQGLANCIQEEYKVKAAFYGCDVTDFAGVKATVAAVKEDFGTVDILVNNAGITRDGLVAVMKESDFDDVLAVNLKGAFHLIRHVTPLMIRNKGGKIINISSIAGLMGNGGQANYAASKAGLIGLTKSVARELAGRNITCNAIAPGFIQTEMTKSFDETDPFVASIPLKRMGSVDDVAAAAAFLADSGADYITGEVLRVDGGLAI
ncbi:MAG TPA: 3-oxoacyl-[acyl-carrier-protein] reductase [Clostridiales bacterium]|nr:3-oxoacyl-[acyl-carrier-protein] reductase [Clostridiales bacterium]